MPSATLSAGRPIFPERLPGGNQNDNIHQRAAGMFFNGDPGIPYGYINNHYTNFAPRRISVGPQGQWPAEYRASYGIFYDRPNTFFNAKYADGRRGANKITTPSPAAAWRILRRLSGRGIPSRAAASTKDAVSRGGRLRSISHRYEGDLRAAVGPELSGAGGQGLAAFGELHRNKEHASCRSSI